MRSVGLSPPTANGSEVYVSSETPCLNTRCKTQNELYYADPNVWNEPIESNELSGAGDPNHVQHAPANIGHSDANKARV